VPSPMSSPTKTTARKSGSTHFANCSTTPANTNANRRSQAADLPASGLSSGGTAAYPLVHAADRQFENCETGVKLNIAAQLGRSLVRHRGRAVRRHHRVSPGSCDSQTLPMHGPCSRATMSPNCKPRCLTPKRCRSGPRMTSRRSCVTQNWRG